MSVLYNMTALQALRLFLDGAECGLPESVFASAEKSMGAAIPKAARNFAAKFFYLPANSGETRIGDFHIIHDSGSGSLKNYIVVGYDKRLLYAVLENDQSENPPVYEISRRYDRDEVINLNFSGFCLEDLLAKAVVSGLLPYCEAAYGTSDDENSEIIRIFGADKKQLSVRGDCGISLCYNEDRCELGAFWMSCGKLESAAVLMRNAQGIEKIPFGEHTDAELKSFFDGEFYINSINCDYEHALMINTERINRSEQSGAPATATAELMRLSARCLWALGRYNEAEKLYNDAAAAFAKSLSNTYTALANMYSEQGNSIGADTAFKAVAALGGLWGDCDATGTMYWQQAEKLDKDIETIDKAIELYEKAIAEFQKAEHPNKHDIAHCQQLRGEARRRKKELLKSQTN